MNTLTLPENGDLHVIPETETKPHIKSKKCWCRPTQEEPGIWLHGEARHVVEIEKEPNT